MKLPGPSFPNSHLKRRERKGVFQSKADPTFNAAPFPKSQDDVVGHCWRFLSSLPPKHNALLTESPESLLTQQEALQIWASEWQCSSRCWAVQVLFSQILSIALAFAFLYSLLFAILLHSYFTDFLDALLIQIQIHSTELSLNARKVLKINFEL